MPARLQYGTCVAGQKFRGKIFAVRIKPQNQQKFSPLKNLGYTVYSSTTYITVLVWWNATSDLRKDLWEVTNFEISCIYIVRSVPRQNHVLPINY